MQVATEKPNGEDGNSSTGSLDFHLYYPDKESILGVDLGRSACHLLDLRATHHCGINRDLVLVLVLVLVLFLVLVLV